MQKLLLALSKELAKPSLNGLPEFSPFTNLVLARYAYIVSRDQSIDVFDIESRRMSLRPAAKTERLVQERH